MKKSLTKISILAMLLAFGVGSIVPSYSSLFAFSFAWMVFPAEEEHQSNSERLTKKKSIDDVYASFNLESQSQLFSDIFFKAIQIQSQNVFSEVLIPPPRLS